ncbi:MAG: amino acid adenylation domain-containing protein [Gloeotrichia echinulata GP01]
MLRDDKGVSIHQLVEFQVSQTPDAIAVIFQDQQLTYRELNQKANQLAHHLKSLGVKPETLVGVCVERSLEMLIALLGILKAGGAYIPLDPGYPQERLEFMLLDSHLPILLTQQHLLERFPRLENVQVVCVDTDWQNIIAHSTENIDSGVSSENLAYTIYTSGSTGKPKGVQIKHRSVVNLLLSMQREPGLTAEDTLLAITTISFDIAVLELFLPLIVGARIILASHEVVADGKQLSKILTESGTTVIQATPATWRLLLATGWQGNKHLKMLCGGEAMTQTLANQLLDKGGSLWNMYGPTETTVWSMVYKVERDTNTVFLGSPIANTQIYLLEEPIQNQNDSPKLAPVGVPGEVYIAGDGVARGYLNRAELNGERFIHNPFSHEPGSRLYKTGDSARYLPDGNLEFIGRIDHQVKIRGFRVELGDIEAVLSQHPSIREVAVIAKEDRSFNQRLLAYVVPKTHTDELESTKLIEQSHTEQLQEWKRVWNANYNQSFEDSDPTFNIGGWNDSTTNLPIPSDEMHEWLKFTVERILALRPQRILDIGCGMGILLFRLAPHCTHYLGLDMSSEAIDHIQQQLKDFQQDWSHVQVSQRSAHELDELEPESFDTVIINSVIQYFPSVNYLVQVIEKIVKLFKPGGQIFIGDVRSLPLLEVFHTAIQLNQAVASLSSHQLQQRICQKIIHERELVLHPDFFQALKRYIPKINHVQTLLKRGNSQNELIRFRLDVILHVETEVCQDIDLLCWDWEQENLSVLGICQFLQQHQPKTVKISNVFDARVFPELKATELLASPNKPETVGELKAALLQMTEKTAVHPEQFWSITQYLPYKVYITSSQIKTPGKYDVVLRRQLLMSDKPDLFVLPEKELEFKHWNAYANNPLKVNEKINLVPQLRSFLKEKLPDYMLPSTFVLMEKLPLTPNGKIDRRSLPEPKKERPILTEAYVAPSTILEQQLADIWSEVLGVEQIGIYDNFFELGGHSLLTAQLLAQIEQAIQLEIPLFYLLKQPTIAGLIKAIDIVPSLDATAPIEETTRLDLEYEAILDPTICPQVPFLEAKNQPEQIFLTGTTGFLGAFLLHQLLHKTPADIYCLVRASHAEDARQKIQANLQRYLLSSGALSSRVIPIIGDLSQPLLGLTDEKFKELSNKLDMIYHSGAFVNLMYPYNALRSANVLGTQEILRLASQGKLTPVHFISTLDVFQSPTYFEMQVIREDTLLDYSQFLDNGYAQTKWVAEKLVMSAQSRGIPASIYRLGMISGHSQTGVSQTNDLMCRIIKGMIQIKSAPDLDQWVNLTPIDYASQAIFHLSQQPESIGKVFHIVNPDPLPWSQLVSNIRSFGYPIQLLPHQDWQTQLLKLDNSSGNALNPILSLFTETNSPSQMTYLEKFLVSAQAFDCQNTLNGLASTSIVCPSLNAKLMNVYFYYLMESGFLKPPVLPRQIFNDKLDPIPLG